MPLIQNNSLVKGARGKFGDEFVYKNHGGRTLITRIPVKNKDAVPSEKQEDTRDKFASAALYAQGALSSPDLKKEYQKKVLPGKTASNLAMRDYFKAPVVKKIDATKYTGSIGSLIVVKAKDDFRVVEVTVSIRNAAGVLVEEGTAHLNPVDHNKWIYTAVQNNALLAGCIVRATAKDLPGNEGILEMTI